MAKLMPSARDDSDASKLLIDLYPRERNARQFASLTPELFERIAKVLTPDDTPEFWQRQEHALEEAMRLLASEISGLGLQPEMRERSNASGIAHSPFYEVVHATEALLASSPEAVAAVLDAWKQIVARCRSEMEVVYEHMESAGISVELVFDLKTIQACLVRMEAIAKVLTATEPRELDAAIQALLVRLIEGNVADKHITSLLRENLNLLARKVVDRTGDTGEHYIASSRTEYWQMWRAAIGGGLLTVLTAAVKLRIIEADLPPFVEGFASGTNYAVSFVMLQVFGLVLATKQPATTAAAFARIIRDNRGLQRSSKLTDFVARITSTQLAAAVGNVAAVSMGAVLFEMLWRWIFRESYLPELGTARHVYDTLNPFASGTALYAIETGVILWMAALAGSWIENAAAYYRLAEAVAQHPLSVRLGERLSRKMSRIVKHNIGGWATSIVLGYLLGFAPEVGHFFGLPIDIRHVTLSSGTLALAAARFGTGTLGDRWFLRAVTGIGVIFVLNLFTSFSIAAYVALRAYDVRLREQLGILRFLVVDAIRAPLRFIVPRYNGEQTKSQEVQGEPS